MTGAEFIAEWNANGCRGCMQRFGLSQWSVGYHVRRLRSAGHTLRHWPNTGRPRMVDRHAKIGDLWMRLEVPEIAELTGLTRAQVRYSVNVACGVRGAR